MRFFICLVALACCAMAMEPMCLRDAMRKPDGSCMCPAKEVGDGDFCCAGDGFDMCQIRGDPRLKSINGESVRMDYPCTHQVAKIFGRDGDRRCAIRVFTAGQFVDDGFIATTKVAVQVKVGTNPIKYIQISGYSFMRPGGTRFINTKHNPGPHIININGAEFELRYDPRDMFVELRGCDAEVRFRPSKFTDSSQHGVPGVCILSPPGTWAGATQYSNACKLDAHYQSLRFNTTTERLLSESIENHMSLPDGEKFDTRELKMACDALDGFFQSCTSRQRADAINTCGSMMTHTPTRRCLARKGTDIFVGFCDCIAAYCSRSRVACSRLKMDEGVKSCVPMVTNCMTWT